MRYEVWDVDGKICYTGSSSDAARAAALRRCRETGDECTICTIFPDGRQQLRYFDVLDKQPSDMDKMSIAQQRCLW